MENVYIAVAIVVILAFLLFFAYQKGWFAAKSGLKPNRWMSGFNSQDLLARSAGKR